MFIDAFTRANGMMTGISAGQAHYDSVVGALFIGFVSGHGGAILLSLANALLGEEQPGVWAREAW